MSSRGPAKAAARGSYRSILTVLIDGPDYQSLSPNAKLVLLTLKLNLGPSGIDVLYAPVLESQTGLSPDQVLLALTTLEHANWIRRERNVIWLVDGLKYEPSRTLSNSNHHTEIAEHLESLPRLNIIEAFRRYYGIEPLVPASDPAPLPPPSEPSPANGPSNGITDGMGDGIGKHGRRKTEDGRRTRETSPREPLRGVQDPPRFSLAPYLEAHQEHFPGSDPPAARYGKAFKRLEAKHGAAETLRRWRNCLEQRKTFATPEELGSHWSAYDAATVPDSLEARAAALHAQDQAAEAESDAWLERRLRGAS